MPAHAWKKSPLPESPQELFKFGWLPTSVEVRVWHCGRCGSYVAAAGLMSLSDARRRAKIPFDCDLQMVRSVHSL